MGKSNRGRATKARARMAFMAFGPRDVEKNWSAAFDAAIREGKTRAQAARIADRTLAKSKAVA